VLDELSKKAAGLDVDFQITRSPDDQITRFLTPRVQ
jgi:hypothetical protein